MHSLDVGFFGPMKSTRRTPLKAYANQDLIVKLFVKTEFPRMLKELMASMSPEKLLPITFGKCDSSTSTGTKFWKEFCLPYGWWP
jgi:hypothetical protein